MEKLISNVDRLKRLRNVGDLGKWAASDSGDLSVRDLVEWLEGEDWLGQHNQINSLNDMPFRLPIDFPASDAAQAEQYVGTVASGSVFRGSAVRVSPSGKADKVSDIWVGESRVEQASTGQSVVVALESGTELPEGSVIASTEHPAEVANQFNVHLLWMAENELLAGREYLFKTVNQMVSGQITDIKYRLDQDGAEHLAAKTLGCNEIGVCNIAIDNDIAFDSYHEGPLTGSFWLLDRKSHKPMAAGLIDFALRRAANIHRQSMDVDKQARSVQKNQKPAILWLTGLSGSGKSTIANAVEQALVSRNRHTYVLDGDNVRHGLNQDLGFTDADRVENIRRIGEVAKLMVDAGLVVMTSFISPFRAERDMVRRLVDNGEFIEIFVDTPLEACAERDPKGLYKKAMAGEIKNFTGFDSPYEAPENPDIRLDTVNNSAEQCADQVMQYLTTRGYLS